MFPGQDAHNVHTGLINYKPSIYQFTEGKTANYFNLKKAKNPAGQCSQRGVQLHVDGIWSGAAGRRLIPVVLRLVRSFHWNTNVGSLLGC
jgi:hypothetical protein